MTYLALNVFAALRQSTPSALTAAQLEVLRRIRIGDCLVAPPRIFRVADELGLLLKLGFVERRGTGRYALSTGGRQWLWELSLRSDEPPQR